MKKQKKILLITVLATAALIGIVYAAFTALTLKINTSATASASIFSVGFDDVAPFTGVTAGKLEQIAINALTPTEGDKVVTFSVSGLKAPGDSAHAMYEIINNGDVDASDITCQIGPAIEGENDWPEEYVPSSTSWVSDDGVFEFVVNRVGFSDDKENREEYWDFVSEELGKNTNSELKAGKKGAINISVTLLKRVDTDTEGSCTVKLIATPGNLGIE